MNNFSVKRFEHNKDENQWNCFVEKAKNQTFLFNRKFMDYHRERFIDHSIMVFNNSGDIIACFPANETEDGKIVSHQGLTYGSVIVNIDIKLVEFLAIFCEILRYYHYKSLKIIEFKKMPDFYNDYTAGELDYALFITNSKMFRRDIAIAINQNYKLSIQNRRQRGVNKAIKNGAMVIKSEDIQPFYDEILTPNLKKRFGVLPVHSLEELKLLMDLFPNNIVHYTAAVSGEIMAGAIIFLTKKVAHAQYISASQEGRNNGSLDFLFKELIENIFSDREMFDFGICNEDQGRKINRGLLEWKEGFGGRGYPHDFYRISTNNFTRLREIYV